MADGNYWLSHDAQDIDDTIDEVQAARGDSADLSARLAAIVSDFETDQQRQDNEISSKASLNDIYGIKNQLPNGTDLNNLSAGIMMCPGATVAASLLNCPTTTDAFIIYTDYLAASSRVIQRIYSFSTTTGIPAQYMRVRWSQGWTPWYQVMMQSVASAQSAASLMQAGRLDAELTDAQEVTENDT